MSKQKRIVDVDTYTKYLDMDILEGTKMYGQELHDFVKPHIHMIPKTKEHIKVDPNRCNGCGDCVIICPGGCFEMVDNKAVWARGDTCFECGTCWHLCDKAHAIDWDHPEAGTGVVLKWS